MTRRDTRGLPRPDPCPEPDTSSYQVVENVLAISDCRRVLLLLWTSQSQMYKTIRIDHNTCITADVVNVTADI